MVKTVRDFPILFILGIISAACPLLQAANINVSVECSTPGQTTYSFSGNSCYSEGYNPLPSPNVTNMFFGYQQGDASASFAFGDGGPVTFSHDGEVTYTGPDHYQIGLSMTATSGGSPAATANASVTYTATYYTAGPERPGYVRGYAFVGAARYGGYFGGYYQVTGPHGVVLSACNPGGLLSYFDDCTVGSVMVGNILGNGGESTPITLGVPYTVTVGLFADAGSDDGTPSYAITSFDFGLGFLEGDNRTAAVISEVPEPATCVLAVLPLGLAWLRRKKWPTQQ